MPIDLFAEQNQEKKGNNNRKCDQMSDLNSLDYPFCSFVFLPVLLVFHQEKALIVLQLRD